MLFIRKQRPSPEVTREINRVKNDVNWDDTASPGPETARLAFDQMDKSLIRNQLLKEQKWLCAYCMRKIRNDDKTVIEHWYPITADASQALSYHNLFACCDGGRRNDTTPHVLCCDASKKDQRNKQLGRKYRICRSLAVFPFP